MSQRAKRRCTYPGCGALVNGGRCPDHATTGLKTTAERGYGTDWEALAKLKLATDPFCQIRTHCMGVVATQVDHKKRFRGVNDPLRLDWDNLQSTCEACHVAKTIRERKGREDVD